MKTRTLLLLALLMPLVANPALAAAVPQSLGKFGFWQTFQVTEGNQPVCYMSLTGPAPQPPAKKGKSLVKRGNVVLMITHRPAEGSKDVVSYAAGLKFKNASDAKIQINGKEFALFTQNDTAWSRDAATDHALSLAIRSADALTMVGESARDDALADSVKLKGADQAYLAISKACGVAIEHISTPKEAKPAQAPKAKKGK